MALPTGHGLPLPEAFLALPLPRNPTGRCAVPPIARCIPKNGVPPRDGSLRVLYAARIGHCRSCPLRVQCQESSTTIKPRRVSAVFWLLESPLSDSSPTREDTPEQLPLAPVVWKDWPRCRIRREWLKVVRSETVGLTSSTTLAPSPVTLPTENILTRAQRAHWRLSWEQRLARNARPSDAPPLIVTLHGLPATFAHSFGFALLATTSARVTRLISFLDAAVPDSFFPSIDIN